MNSFMKGSMLLLLLAAVSINADDEHCGGLNITMPGADLHKVVGHWVLVLATSDSKVISVDNLTNSHVSMHLSSDNSTIIYSEQNRFLDGSCSIYNATFSIVADHHSVDLVDMTEEKDGVVGPFNDSATAQFFETCPECLSMVYRGKLGEFLLNYRKEGHHKDLEKIAENHNELEKLSKCLEIPVEGAFIYKGQGDFCHQSSHTEEAVEAHDA